MTREPANPNSGHRASIALDLRLGSDNGNEAANHFLSTLEVLNDEGFRIVRLRGPFTDDGNFYDHYQIDEEL